MNLLDRISKSLDDRPLALGTVACTVIRLTSDPEIDVAKLARAISADLGLAGTIICKANSAFYAGGWSVGSLPQAILKLGFLTTRSLIIAGSVQSMFRRGDSEGLEQYLWQHSLTVGLGARIVLKNAGRSCTEEGFTCGLLHDIAKLVMLQRFSLIYSPILRVSRQQDADHLEIEVAQMGFTHADLGAMILERWDFGPAETLAVRFHHQPDRACTSLADDKIQKNACDLAHAICLANEIAKQIELKPDGSKVKNGSISSSAEYFQFSVEQIGRIRADLMIKVGEELQVFCQEDARNFQ